VDVVVSSGHASGTNTRTIYSSSGAINEQTWSPASGVNKIAFIATSNTILTVPTSGGSTTTIYSPGSSVQLSAITWSNDGTKLGFVERTGSSGSYSWAVKVMDLSGTLIATPVSGWTSSAISGLQWSKTGRDALAFVVSSSGVNTIYTIPIQDNATMTAVASGTSTATNPLKPFWSPNNSEMVYTLYGGGSSKVDVASGSKTSLGSFLNGMWKQP
jgi:hypothetical protein